MYRIIGFSLTDGITLRTNFNFRLYVVFIVSIIIVNGVNAQPIALRGSYAASITDGVDVFSGKLENVLPLIGVPGRGDVSQGLYLPLRNLDWYVIPTGTYEDPYMRRTYYEARLGYFTMGGVAMGTPPASVTRGGYGYIGRMEKETRYTGMWERPTVTTLKFTSNNGSIIEFRDALTNGQPLDAMGRGCYLSGYIQPPQPPPACSRGRVFKATDGSNAIFVADTDVYDILFYDYQGTITTDSYVSGRLILNNGTQMIFANGMPGLDGTNTLITRVTDRNGNYLDFEYAPANVTPYYQYLTKATDSLKREIAVTYGDHNQPAYYDEIIYKGFGGTEKRIRINYEGVENAMLPGHALTPIFPGVRTSCFMITGGNPCPGYPLPYGTGTPAGSAKVVSSVVLPNGKEYRIYYNEYLEVARIKNPLGSYIDYEYSSSQVGADADGYKDSQWGDGGSIGRRVSSVKSFSEAGQLVSQKTLGYPPQYVSSSQTTIDNVAVEVKDGSGNTISRSKHYFYGSADTLGKTWRTGKEFKSEALDLVSNTVLRKTETSWEQRAPFEWCSGILQFYACDETNWPGSSPLVDPRITEIKTTLETGQVTKKTFGYDQYNNVTDTYEYDYGSGQPGPFLKRIHTDYVTDTNYINSHLRSLPLQTWVSSDPAGTNRVTLTQFEYDNYSSGANHAPLVSRSSVAGHDTINYGTSFTVRGNVTAVTSYENAHNQTGSVTAHTQYDILGNVVKTIDARGNVNTVDYSDRFGSPEGDARNNSAPPLLNNQSTFAFATSATNAVGWTTYLQRDYHTGAIVDSEDINGNVNTTFYNDGLDRPTQTISNNNRPTLKAQAAIDYDDVNRKVTVTTDSKAYGDNLIKTESFYDGFGRTVETRAYETSSNYIKALTEYDSLGRRYRSCNPFRPHLNESPQWTTTSYDSLGRVIEVKTADNATVTRAYSGTSAIATDQAGRSRAATIDALGRLTTVIEYDNGAQHETYYTYDVLGLLRKTAQTSGQTTQNRYFMYNDLGQLIRSRQVEQGTNSNLNLTDPITGNSSWSTAYNYDGDGNIISTTDALNRTITGTYDVLNRLTYRNYSETSMPDVTLTYDDPNVANSRGQLTAVNSSVSTTNYTAFDVLGRVKSNSQTIGGQTYTMPDYSYDLSGALLSQTYPSGRVVSTETDDIGRLSHVASQLPGQVSKTLLSNLDYTSFGAVRQAKLGNGRWESAQFDTKRLQVKQIGLGGSAGDASLLKLEFDYGTTNNDGSLLQQKITVPGAGNQIIQTYTYDYLNRLSTATETVNTSQQWKQTFAYDRFGNRRFDANNTTTLPANSGTHNPQIDPLTNRFLTSEGYSYDAEGNLTANPESQVFTYDAENRQTQVQNTSTPATANYSYDGNGKRVKKVIGDQETVFVYDAFGKLIAEYTVNQVITQNGTQYITADALGTPRVITGAIGRVVSRHDYMPFGEEVASGVGGRTTVQGYAQANNAPQKFTGYERDDESGLDFAQNRYYSGKYGRFTSVDPTLASIRLLDPQSFNRFAYVGNDPVNYTDPSGLCKENGVETGLPCPNFSGQVYQNPDGSFSNSDAGGGRPYNGPTLNLLADGVAYQVVGGSNGGWTTGPVAQSEAAPSNTIETSNPEVSTEIMARPLEPVPEAPQVNAAVASLLAPTVGPQSAIALIAIQTTEMIAGQDILADGISLQVSIVGIELGGTYTRDGTIFYGWDTGQYIGSAPYSAILQNIDGRKGGIKSFLGASLTGTKFLTAGRLGVDDRDAGFEGASGKFEGTYGVVTGAFGKSSSGRYFISGGLSTPSIGGGVGVSNNTKLTSFRGPIRW